MTRARSRPPHLESRSGDLRPAPAPTLEDVLDRARVTGRSGAPGSAEFRRLVERIVAGDRAVLGELAPTPGTTVVDAWAAIAAVFGAHHDEPTIDARHTVAAIERAASRIADVARAGGQLAFATAAPASLLPMYLALGRIARRAGARVDDEDDVGPFRADGRTPRWMRWFDGVATVTDGRSLCATSDGTAAREWLFVLARPALLIADGPFAEAACSDGIDVVAFAGLDRCGLALPARQGDRLTVVPMRTDRPPASYRAALEHFDRVMRASGDSVH